MATPAQTRNSTTLTGTTSRPMPGRVHARGGVGRGDRGAPGPAPPPPAAGAGRARWVVPGGSTCRVAPRPRRRVPAAGAAAWSVRGLRGVLWRYGAPVGGGGGATCRTAPGGAPRGGAGRVDAPGPCRACPRRRSGPGSRPGCAWPGVHLVRRPASARPAVPRPRSRVGAFRRVAPAGSWACAVGVAGARAGREGSPTGAAASRGPSRPRCLVPGVTSRFAARPTGRRPPRLVPPPPRARPASPRRSRRVCAAWPCRGRRPRNVPFSYQESVGGTESPVRVLVPCYPAKRLHLHKLER